MINKKKFGKFIIKIKLTEDKCVVFSEKFEMLSLIIYNAVKDIEINLKSIKDLYKIENLIKLYNETNNDDLYNYIISQDEVNNNLTLNSNEDLSVDSHFHMVNIINTYKNKSIVEPLYIDYVDSYISIDFNLDKFKYSVEYLGETLYFDTMEDCLSIRKGIIKEKITETGNLRLVEMLIF